MTTMSALETAEQLALADGAVAASTGGAADTATWCGQPDPDAVEEVRQSWRLRSRRIGAEFDEATAAIAKANDAVASDIATDNAPELRAELALANLRGPDQVRHWWDRRTDIGTLGFGDDRREIELVTASATTNPHFVAVASSQDEIRFAQKPVARRELRVPTR